MKVKEVSGSRLAAVCGGTGILHAVLTAAGVVVLSFMMTMYALESRGRRFVLLFAVGCALSSAYGFASGAWPFGIVELVWAGVAVNRSRRTP